MTVGHRDRVYRQGSVGSARARCVDRSVSGGEQELSGVKREERGRFE